MTEAKPKKFEVVKDTEIQKKNDWYFDCRKREVPYVVVTTEGQKALVQWDYFAFEPGPKEARALGKTRQLRDAQIAMYQRYAAKDSECQASGAHADFYRIPMPNALAFAEELYDYLFEEICHDETVPARSPASTPEALAIALNAVLFEAKQLGFDIDAICNAAAEGMVIGGKLYRSGSANWVVPATEAIRAAQQAASAS